MLLRMKTDLKMFFRRRGTFKGHPNLTEEVNDKTTGAFNLQVIQGGTLEGEWTYTDGTKKFDITLKMEG